MIRRKIAVKFEYTEIQEGEKDARNICISKVKEPVYKALAEGENAILAVIRMFFLAACIGLCQGQKKPLEEAVESIELQAFGGPVEQSLLNAVALQDQKDLKILFSDEVSTDKCLSIIEDYANAGLELLAKRVLESPGDPLDNLTEYVMAQYAAENESKEESVTSVMDAIFK